MTYLVRLSDAQISKLLGEVPAVFVTGPRAVGKTTTAERYAHTVVRLDGPEGEVFRADPDAALRGLDEPVLLDEWQVVPSVLAAVKRTLDREPYRPGRYIVTGSARSANEPHTWPGTGRLVRVTMFGLTQREFAGHIARRSFVDRLIAGDLSRPAKPPDLLGYVEMALRSGFPELALHVPETARGAWIGSYVDQLVARDIPRVDAPRDPARLRRYLHACAASTAGVVDHSTLYESAGIDRKTAVAYDGALESLVVTDLVPAWHTNRLKRLARLPKRYVIDSALAAELLGVDARGVMRDPDVLGRLIDTFVASQLRAELALTSPASRLFHLRDTDGRREVDLLVERPDDSVVAVEVKAGQPHPRDARHLQWLRDQLGKDFAAGVLLHTGSAVMPIGDAIVAAPICSLWE